MVGDYHIGLAGLLGWSILAVITVATCRRLTRENKYIDMQALRDKYKVK